MVQGLLPNTEASFIVEQVPLLAIRQRPGVDWRHITVGLSRNLLLLFCQAESTTQNTDIHSYLVAHCI